MKITLRVEGGLAHFPGLARPRSLDTRTLAPEDARALHTLVTKAGVRGDTAAPAPPPRSAPTSSRDHRTYTIEIEDAHERHRRVFTDPVPAPLAELLRALEPHLRPRGP